MSNINQLKEMHIFMLTMLASNDKNVVLEVYIKLSNELYTSSKLDIYESHSFVFRKLQIALLFGCIDFKLLQNINPTHIAPILEFISKLNFLECYN